jgi:two-component system phosphate regulon sensor histidine kinase PhoR
MWRSPTFWRLLLAFGGPWLLAVGLLGGCAVAWSAPEARPEQAWLPALAAAVVTLSAAAALAAAWWSARGITRPVGELTRAAERIAAGQHGQQVFAAGTDEVADLARAFNHMSERLAATFAQLEEDRQQLRTILSAMVEGVVALDTDQRILFANDRAAHLLDFRGANAVGRKLWEVVRHRPLQEVVRKALAGPEPLKEEVSLNGPGQRSLTVHAARLPGAAPRGAVLVLHDTSELRRLERLRQDFVANVSHELKTPLTTIKACVETLLEGAIDDVEHRTPFLEQVADQSERLHALILDLLSLGRIESGSEAYEFEVVPLAPLVAACLERHHARAEAKSQRLEAVTRDGRLLLALGARGEAEAARWYPESDPVAAWADEDALSQVLDNLVDNAVKYTPPRGTIRVRWWAEDTQVCLEVEDTGIGIPQQDLPRIFERFYRVDKARSRQLGGTGLGLSIVKHLVQAMQGSVTADSRLGRGTTFTVRLPRGPA